MTATDLGTLVRRARSGDERAWSALHDRTNAYVVSIARRDFRLGGAAADDISQEVWLRLFRSIDRIDHPDRVLGWLRQTTVRACLSHLRGRWVRSVVADDDRCDRQPSLDASPDECLMRSLTERAVRGAVGRSSGVGARVLAMQLADPDVSYDQISDRLSIPRGAIGPQRGRALRRIAADPEIAALR